MNQGKHTGGETFRAHWPEYLMEATELGLFMISACLFTVLLEHPSSPVPALIPEGNVRRLLMGLAMGLTAMAIIYSPMGKQSGAHFNPAVTLAFHRLGKISFWDAVFYIGAQFLGAIGGMAVMGMLWGAILRHQTINYVATLPGKWGGLYAFVAEAGISFVMMTMVLTVSNHPRWARFTGVAAGLLVALFIFVEAPVSGMSMNPARSFGSAAIPGLWTHLWIYLLAPTAGMLLAAQFKERVGRTSGIFCAKLHHTESKRCIFCRHQRGEL